jgi:hypothetical protein
MLQKMYVVKRFARLQAVLQALIQGMNVMLVLPRHDSQSVEKVQKEG